MLYELLRRRGVTADSKKRLPLDAVEGSYVNAMMHGETSIFCGPCCDAVVEEIVYLIFFIETFFSRQEVGRGPKLRRNQLGGSPLKLKQIWHFFKRNFRRTVALNQEHQWASFLCPENLSLLRDDVKNRIVTSALIHEREVNCRWKLLVYLFELFLAKFHLAASVVHVLDQAIAQVTESLDEVWR